MRVIALLFIASVALAQGPDNRERILRHVRQGILGLPFYGTFDWITYQVNGSTVTLRGATVRSTIKEGAQELAQKIEGVRRVVNLIDVLPLGFYDDEIRFYVHRAIMRRPGMARYASQGPNSPLHILVKNGHVTLEGFIGREADRQVVTLQARRVPGVFSVRNNLRVEAGDD